MPLVCTASGICLRSTSALISETTYSDIMAHKVADINNLNDGFTCILASDNKIAARPGGVFGGGRRLN